jgi:hypothetical protein
MRTTGGTRNDFKGYAAEKMLLKIGVMKESEKIRQTRQIVVVKVKVY